MRLRLARVLFAVALSVLFAGGSAAGVPSADECCESGCAGELGRKHCPPTCEYSCPCPKLQNVVDAQPLPAWRPRQVSAVLSGELTAPDLPLLTSDVFHPPRR